MGIESLPALDAIALGSASVGWVLLFHSFLFTFFEEREENCGRWVDIKGLPRGQCNPVVIPKHTRNVLSMRLVL